MTPPVKPGPFLGVRVYVSFVREMARRREWLWFAFALSVAWLFIPLAVLGDLLNLGDDIRSSR